MKTAIAQKSGLKLSSPSGLGATPGYEGAASARRLSAWRPSNSHVNTLLKQAGDTMVARGRWLVRNNPYARRGQSSWVANGIGTGIYPSSKIAEDDLRGMAEELFLQWTDEADADGLTDFYGQQSMVARGMFEAGEEFARFRSRRQRDMATVPFQVQLMESEQLPRNKEERLKNGHMIRQGVEFNRIGRRVAYHFLREHPGDRQVESFQDNDTRRILANQIMHCYEPLRPGQLRGQTQLSAIITKCFILESYDDAELERKRTAALLIGFILKGEGEGPFEGEGEVDALYRQMLGLSPGTLQELNPGEDVKFSDPADVGGNYEAFQYRNLLAHSVGMDVPYVNVAGDLRGVSYSSIRAGIVEFRRRVEQWQHQTMVFQFCRPVWNRFMDEAVLSGKLQIPGYTDNRQVYIKVEWVPDRWDWVDPLKDRQGERLAKEMYAKTTRQIAMQEGNNIDDIIRDEQKTAQKLTKAGLPVLVSTKTWDVEPEEVDGDPTTGTPTKKDELVNA